MTRIFISHSSEQSSLVRRLSEFIAPFGYEVSVSSNFRIGARWTELIAEAVLSADIVLVLYDEKSTSPLFELGYLFGLRRPTVVIADVAASLPLELADVNCVRIEGFDEVAGYRILAALASLKDRIRGKGEPPLDSKYQATLLVEMNPIDFERTISNWFWRQSFQVEHINSKDRNFDLIVSSNNGMRCVVEFKRYPRGSLISIENVRGLMDAVISTESDEGILITTSDYTRSALDFAQHLNVPIHLWRTDDIGSWSLSRRSKSKI